MYFVFYKDLGLKEAEPETFVQVFVERFEMGYWPNGMELANQIEGNKKQYLNNFQGIVYQRRLNERVCHNSKEDKNAEITET